MLNHPFSERGRPKRTTTLALRMILAVMLPALSACGQALAAEQARLQAVFFFTPGCRQCGTTKNAVRKAEAAFAGRLHVEWVDMSDPETGAAAANRLFALLDRYGVQGTPELAFFVGSTCLAGGDRIVAGVEPAVEAELRGNPAATNPRPITVNRIGFWAVSLAALADGFNPCAFATVVLLVSMMATAGRTRRQALTIGSAFVLGVYSTYFLIGLVFYGVLQRLTGFFVISDLVYWAAFAACLAFAGLSLRDSFLAFRGAKPQAMLLRLPDRLKTRMQLLMSRGVRARSALFGAVLLCAGAVSLLESACTGQVYFPVIAGMVHTEHSMAQGLQLLAWYNLLFVLPLIGVLACAVWGVSSQRLARFARGRLPLVKLCLAAVFVLMAVWMWPGLTWPPGAR